MESRTQGSRPRPRTQKKSEAKAKDSLSEDRHSRGQGLGLDLRGQGQGLQNVSSRTSSRPRTSSRTPPLISVTWKTNNILNKNASEDNSLPNQLNINGRLISNASSICNEFNGHFSNQRKEMAMKAPALTPNISESFCGKQIQKSIYFEPVSENEVEGIISMFNPNQAQVIDNIPIG